MSIGRALACGAILVSLALTSCSYSGRTVIRNATGAEIFLWPLSTHPKPLKPGEEIGPMVFSGYQDHQAMIERGGCLYTYHTPNYFELPKKLKSHNAQAFVIINEDMSISFRERSKKGVEGPEIVGAGLPLKPTTYCGRRGS